MRGPRELVRGTGGRQDHPSHHRLGHSMGHEYRQVDQGDTRTSQVSWDLKRKGTVEDEDVPLPSEELKRLESLLLSRYKLRFSAF